MVPLVLAASEAVHLPFTIKNEYQVLAASEAVHLPFTIKNEYQV